MIRAAVVLALLAASSAGAAQPDPLRIYSSLP